MKSRPSVLARPFQSDLVIGIYAAASSAVLLYVLKQSSPNWASHVAIAPGSPGVWWQVQSTFLTVGFAGIAIASQLFAETPTAIGATRNEVLAYVRAGRFMVYALAANFVVALDATWLDSNLGALVVAAWVAISVWALIVSYVRLVRLLSHPSKLDHLIRESFVTTLVDRLQTDAGLYETANSDLDRLRNLGVLDDGVPSSNPSVRIVRSTATNQLLHSVDEGRLRHARDMLQPPSDDGNEIVPAHLMLCVDAGARVGPGDPLFRVVPSENFDAAKWPEAERALQTAMNFEPTDFVTPGEETSQELTMLQDAVSTALRAGAFGVANRALTSLELAIRQVWLWSATNDAQGQWGRFRRDRVYRMLAITESDYTHSPQATRMFLSHLMSRALDAPSVPTIEYFVDVLRGFDRLWIGLLTTPVPEIRRYWQSILVDVQNLAEFGFGAEANRKEFQTSAVWALVELVKAGLDVQYGSAGPATPEVPDAVRAAVRYLASLFEYGDDVDLRRHVVAGRLVLSGWLLMQQDREGWEPDPSLASLLLPGDPPILLLQGRTLASDDDIPYSRWTWWEMSEFGPAQVTQLGLERYVDRALLAALEATAALLPTATEQSTNNTYRRLLELASPDQTGAQTWIAKQLGDRINEWKEVVASKLVSAPISHERVARLNESIRAAFDAAPRLADQFDSGPADAGPNALELSREYRAPREYFVDATFDNVYADPTQLGPMIARWFIDEEDKRLVEELRSLPSEKLEPTTEALLKQLSAVPVGTTDWALVVPYGGPNIDGWWTSEVHEAVGKVTLVETSVLQEHELVLLKGRRALRVTRAPQPGLNRNSVDGTSLAVGVGETGEAPTTQVRIEACESLMIQAGTSPNVIWFAIAT